MRQLYKKTLLVTIFAIAMALLESAVVIYLREIMYPDGFSFPLSPIQPQLALTELLREAATIIMLFCIGIMSGRTFSQRFAWFIYSFAIWDIFYYIFLWLLIGWPDSLITWDVLFLIPATWTGPVIAPLLLTIVMIIFSGIIVIASEKGVETRIQVIEWIGLIIGSVVVILAFVTDYLKHMLSVFSFSELFSVRNPRLLEYAEEYVPESFPWLIFIAGILLILAAVSRFAYRINHSTLKTISN
jgi:hypothetical protein